MVDREISLLILAALEVAWVVWVFNRCKADR